MAGSTGRGSGGGTCRPLSVVAWDGSTRDSGSHFQANAMLHRHRAAATRPGAACPARAAKEPTTGPITTPRLVAADSQPKALARSCGAIVSATYAWATPVVPPPRPWMKRDTNSNQSDAANPKTAYAMADAVRPTSNAGRRPYRSDTRPQTGEAISCATGNEAVKNPIVVASACRSFA